MLRDGSSSLRSTPSVALMMPAPMRTTSGSVLNVSGMEALFAVWVGKAGFPYRAPRSGRDTLGLARAKRHRGPRLKDDIRAPPGTPAGRATRGRSCRRGCHREAESGATHFVERPCPQVHVAHSTAALAPRR